MARPNTLRFGAFKISIEGDTPGTYTEPCGFTEKSLTFSQSPTEVDLPDCADPDAPGWIGRDPGPMSASVSGSGVFALEAYPVWQGWMITDGGASRNIRVAFDNADGGYYEGAALMTSLGTSAPFRGRLQASVELVSDGEWTWTDGVVGA